MFLRCWCSSCAELLALFGIGGVVIKGNVAVAGGFPGGQSILVAVTNNILGSGTVFFESQPEFCSNGDNAFYEIDDVEPGNY